MKDIVDKIIAFRDDRNWDQFQTVKDLLLGLNIEVGELQEIFLWHTEKEEINIEDVKYELADIFIFLVYISDKYKIDLKQAILEKIEIHNNHYPIKKSKNKNIKYNKLDNGKNS